MNNVTPIPSKFSELHAAVANIRKDIGAMIEMQTYIAQMRRASFDAHIKEGFTPEQAIILCAKVTI
jgi:hypothetical protein